MADSFAGSMMKSTGPSMSLVENKGVGIGNYKGVMLCNRPFGGTATSTKAPISNADKNTFTCGVVAEPIGVNTTMSSKEKMKLRRPKKETVLTKHRKWLADLQKTKDKLEAQYMDELMKKEEEKQKFQDQEAKMRKTTIDLLHSAEAKPESDSKISLLDNKDSYESKRSEDKLSPDASSISLPKINVKNSSKPAWALTESSAEIASEEKLRGDEDELLDFAKSLTDVDKYLQDIEVKQMMERLRARISALEGEVNAEDQKEIDAEQRFNKKMMEALEDRMSSTNIADIDKLVNQDINAAKEVLKTDEELQSVHSTKSVAAMLKAAREKNAKGDASDGKTLDSKIANEPMIVIHDPADGKVINPASNLPYIHRNPAV